MAAGASAQPAAEPGVGYGTPNGTPRTTASASPAARAAGVDRRQAEEGAAHLGGVTGGARGAAPHHRHVRQVDLEAVGSAEGSDDRIGLRRADLGACAAVGAIQVSVLGIGPDVELLAPIGSVAVTDQAQLL